MFLASYFDLELTSRYVNNMGESKQSKQECDSLRRDADKVFSSVGMRCKAWTISGLKPDDSVSKDGLTIGVGGFKWNPVEDNIEVKVPNLYFSKKTRGRLSPETVFFDSDLHDIQEFVPHSLTLRQVTSKYASIFDYLGLLSPALALIKVLLRSTVRPVSYTHLTLPTNREV